MLTAVGLGLIGSTSLSACTRPAPSPRSRQKVSAGPDQAPVARAIADARNLLAGAVVLAALKPQLGDLLTRIADVHRAHLRSLGATPEPTPTPTVTHPTTSPTTPAAPVATPAASAMPEATPNQLVLAEWAAARNALRDGEAATPAVGVLLCRIAAARAAHADLVQGATRRPDPGALTPSPPLATPTPPAPASSPPSTITLGDGGVELPTVVGPPSTPTTTPTTTAPPTASPTPMTTATADALNGLLAGEHAAVFAYPLVIAHAGRTRYTLAATLWADHRVERDQLETRLVAAGFTPVASQPAYDVGPLLTTAARTAALAARVETGLAALASDVIAVASGSDRDLGADQLVLAARRTAAWTGRPEAFPGLTSPAATPTTVVTPTT